MKPVLVGATVLLCVATSGVAQTVLIERKPPAIVVRNAQGNRVASIPIGKNERALQSVVSLDKRLLFVVVSKNRGPGSLKIVDLDAGTTTSRPVIDRPIRMLRLGPERRLWVQGDAMQSISETGETGSPIPLKFPGGGYAAGQAVSAGADRVAISLTMNGNPLYRVALIDLKQGVVSGVVQTRSTGQKAKLGSSHFGKDLLKGVGKTLESAGTESVTVHTTYFDYFLFSRGDGNFVYAVDFGTHEVSVIDVPGVTKAATIAFDKSATQVSMATDGKTLILTGKQVQKIDLESNRIED